jgi:hypothetical protein
VPHINGSHNHGIQFCCWWCKEHRRGASLETDNQHRASSGKNKECSKGDGCRAAGRSCSWCLWMRTSTVLFLGAVEVDVVLLQAECARSMKYIMLPERQAQQDGRPRCPVSANSSSGPLCRWTRLAIKDWILFTGYIYICISCIGVCLLLGTQITVVMVINSLCLCLSCCSLSQFINWRKQTTCSSRYLFDVAFLISLFRLLWRLLSTYFWNWFPPPKYLSWLCFIFILIISIKIF